MPNGHGGRRAGSGRKAGKKNRKLANIGTAPGAVRDYVEKRAYELRERQQRVDDTKSQAVDLTRDGTSTGAKDEATQRNNHLQGLLRLREETEATEYGARTIDDEDSDDDFDGEDTEDDGYEDEEEDCGREFVPPFAIYLATP